MVLPPVGHHSDARSGHSREAAVSVPTTTRILTDQDLVDFSIRGYVRLQQAFPRDAALAMQDFMWEQLRLLHGIDRDDPRTWERSWSGLNKKNHDQIYDGIASQRLLAAMAELLTHCTWRRPRNWGGFIVSPPDPVKDAWRVPTTGWHWDGQDRYGLFVFTLFSTVRSREGGTLLLEGSHRLIESFLDQLGPKRPKRLRSKFQQRYPWLAPFLASVSAAGERFHDVAATPSPESSTVRCVEVTGEPGDAVLCHPLLYHARPMHHGEQPRFLRGMLLAGKQKEVDAGPGGGPTSSQSASQP